MAWWRDGLCWVLLAFGAAGLTLGLFPRSDESADAATGDRVAEFRLGFAESPSYHYTRRESARGGFQMNSRVEVFSWSALAVLAGVLSLEGFRARRAAIRKRSPTP